MIDIRDGRRVILCKKIPVGADHSASKGEGVGFPRFPGDPLAGFDVVSGVIECGLWRVTGAPLGVSLKHVSGELNGLEIIETETLVGNDEGENCLRLQNALCR